MKNVVNWFEIPCKDLNRAVSFYEKVFGVHLERQNFMDVPHGIFPCESSGVSGALVEDRNNEPSDKGSVVYLNAPDIDACLSRVTQAGGQVILPKTAIGPQGFIAFLRDTEGNRVGLHTFPV